MMGSLIFGAHAEFGFIEGAGTPEIMGIRNGHP
jgi:hypothetical protein